MRTAGIAYGIVVVLVFAAALWLPDAIVLQQASVRFAWAKLIMGALVCLPIGIVIGWLAASTRWSAVSILLWIVGCASFGLVAGHMPYDGLSWLAELNDPYPPGAMLYPFTLQTAGYTGYSMVIGAGAGLFVGLLSLLVTGLAWEYSTKRNRLSVKSILIMGVCIPPLVIYGLMADFQLSSSTRTAFEDVDQAVRYALDRTHNLEGTRAVFFSRYRDRMSPHYTLIWNSSSDNRSNTVVDIQFDTGLLVRCNHSYGIVSFCRELDTDLKDWMTQLMITGHLTCVGCSVQAERDTRRWLAAVLPSFGALQQVSLALQQVSLLQHQGGWIYERATFDSGRQIDCRFAGNAPIVVNLCIEAK